MSTKLLATIFGAGICLAIFKLLTGQNGSGLGNAIDMLVYASCTLFIASLLVITIRFKEIKRHQGAFLFLLLSIPLTFSAVKNIVIITNYNRKPNLTAKYARPVSDEIFIKDSIKILEQIDSLVALKNRNTGGTKVASTILDTIIYSQSGNQVFVIYAKQFEKNDYGNDLGTGFLSADEKGETDWFLREGPPNAYFMSGHFHNIEDLKREVRKFYFNQYKFAAADSLQENYIWKTDHSRKKNIENYITTPYP